jgi:hypothetical protein
VAGIVTPDIELAGNTFITEDLGHAFVRVPALVVHAGREDVLVVPVAVEIPGIAGVRQIVHGDVEVAVVVVVAGEEAGGVEGAAHGEHGRKNVGVAEGDVECVIAAEAGADGGKLRGLILLTDEGEDFLHEVLLVLHVTGDAPSRRNGAVVPALGV